jgi:hypothetical protein
MPLDLAPALLPYLYVLGAIAGAAIFATFASRF